MLEILIKNKKPATQYKLNNNTYIEGRKGSEYTIRLTNNYFAKRLFVVSVDGLSIVDGKPASSSSRGYILKPFETLDIAGWQINNETAAKFQFSDKNESYTTLIDQGSSNCGVIGLRVYNEKPQVARGHFIPSIPSTPSQPWVPTPTPWNPWEDNIRFDSYTMKGPTKGLNTFNNISTLSATAEPYSASIATASASSSSGEVSRGLGTGYGNEVNQAVTQVAFERGNLHRETVLYYGEAKWLNSLGIKLDWQEKLAKKTTSDTPKAFIDEGFCPRPKRHVSSR